MSAKASITASRAGRAAAILAGLALCMFAPPALSEPLTPGSNAKDSHPPARPADPFAKACALVTVDDEVRLDRACLTAMAFDPKTYFGSDGDSQSDLLEPYGLVDAAFIQGRRGPVWAFVISDSCPTLSDTDPRCEYEQRRLLLRAVTIKPLTERPKPTPTFPRSEEEMRQFLNAVMDWREADLRSCPHAIALLSALNNVRWRVFNEGDLAQMAGRQPSEIIVTADGDTVIVKAGDAIKSHAARDSGEPGGAGAWAKRMRAIVEPCLKPTLAATPWSAGG